MQPAFEGNAGQLESGGADIVKPAAGRSDTVPRISTRAPVSSVTVTVPNKPDSTSQPPVMVRVTGPARPRSGIAESVGSNRPQTPGSEPSSSANSTRPSSHFVNVP